MLNLGTEALGLEGLFPRLTGIGAVGVDVLARICWVHHGVEVLADMGRGRAGRVLADEAAAFHIHIDGELLAKGALAVVLGPGSIQVFLAPLGLAPILWHRALLEGLLLQRALALLGQRNQGSIHDLPAPSDVAGLQKLLLYTLEDGLRPSLPNPVLKRLDRGPNRDAGRVRELAEALMVHPAKKLILHLLVREVVQPREHAPVCAP